MNPSRVATIAAAVVTALALLAGCSPASTHGSSHESPLSSSQRVAREQSQVTKLLVFVVENHSLRQMVRDMPWVSRLATKFGYATGYRAITHPSLPNYLAMAGGDTFSVRDDRPPSAHEIGEPSVFGSALRAGRTAKTYAEGMTSPCQRFDEGAYVVRHNPWTYFSSERRECRRYDEPLRALSGDVAAGALPRVGMVVPDACNDAHDCSLARADSWLHHQVRKVLHGPDFASRHLAVVVTADEDDRHHGNRVLTVVAHPDLHHQVVHRALTHYALSRSYAEAANIDPLGRAVGSRSLLRAFGLQTP